MIATNLQAELSSYVDAGLTPFQALQTATVNSAKSLNLDAGTLEAGKLADITLLEGDPRENIANTFNVRKVIADGQYYDVAEQIGRATSELQSLMRISYAVFCLKKKTQKQTQNRIN